MKQLSFFLTIFLLIFSTGQAVARPLTQEILVPENPVIEVVAAGEVVIAAQEGRKVVVSGSLTRRANNKAVAKKHVEIKATKSGAKIETDHFSRKKFVAKTQILVPADAVLKIKIESGTLKMEKLKGGAEIRQKGGSVTLIEHQGDIKVEMSDGKLNISEYLGEGRSVAVEGKRGEVTASIGAVEVGPGRIQIRKGNISFQIDKGTKIAVHARVTEQGTVKSGKAVSRTDPTTAYFTANGGQALWKLTCEEGTIDLVVPEP